MPPPLDATGPSVPHSNNTGGLVGVGSSSSAAYEARRKRTEWPEGVRMDDEVKALDERNGEWILCRTCAEHYEKTGRGRKPNDPEGFKVKMNGRFQEAAWLMHKNRVVAHKAAHDTGNDSSGSQGGGSPTSTSLEPHHRDPFQLRDQDVIMGIPHTNEGNMSSNPQLDHHDHHQQQQHPAKRLKMTVNATVNAAGSSGSERDGESDDSHHHHHHHVGTLDLVVGDSHEASGPFFMEEMRFDDADSQPQHPLHSHGRGVQLPRTGWRCPGVVPDFFYQANAELVHAFAKYYVGSYRVNVVRDLRSDKVMLYSHDCENRIVHRERPNQPISCDKCYAIWLHNKSFKRILKKMDRYNLVEDILRKSWSITEEDLSVLSKFKHSSGANLNIEGRKLKQAAITVLKRFNARKSPQEKPKPSSSTVARIRLQQQQQQQQQLAVAVLGLPSLESAIPEDDNDHSAANGAAGVESIGAHHHQPLEASSSASTSDAQSVNPQQQQQENAEESAIHLRNTGKQSSEFATTAAVDARRPSGSFFLNRQAQMTDSVSAINASAAEATERATSADAQTYKQLPPSVRGSATSDDSKNDPVVGKRIRKSFGSRFFWGSVVSCYYIADAPFYKISFDDGDVDILAAAEVLQDVKQAEKYAAEDAFVASTTPGCAQEPADDDTAATPYPSPQPSLASRYQDELRQATLKRKRDEQPEPVSDTYTMKVWGQRLFLSVVTSKRVTTVAEFVRQGDGSIGEVEASGKVKIGDIISHINSVPVAGMDSGVVSDRIKASRRPMEITFQRPRPSISFSGATGTVPREKSQDTRSLETDAVRVTDPRTGAQAAEHTAAVPPAAANHAQASVPVPTTSSHSIVVPPTFRIRDLSTQTPAQDPVAAPSPLIPASQPSAVVVVSTPVPPPHPEQQQQQQSQHQDSTQQLASAPAFNNSSNFTFTQQSANPTPVQHYPARPHPQATQQDTEMSSHPANTPFGQQAHGAMPNASGHAWNNPLYRSRQPVRKVSVSFYGMQTTPQPQPSTNSYNLPFGANHAPSYPHPQHPSPQAAAAAAAGLQQFADSHHPTAMATQCPQQTSTWRQSSNGSQTVVSNSPASSSGNNVPNSFMAPSARTTPEFDHRAGSNMLAHRPIQQPPSAQNGPYAWSSSQQSGLESEHRYDSAAVAPPSRSFSDNESRFLVIEPAHEESDRQQEDQQQQYRSEAVDDSRTESDEARGAFALEEDFEDDERELASALGTDMTPFSDSPAAPEAPPTAEETSFLSPNKPSFVSKLPDNLGDRYRQFSSSQYQHQQLFTAGMVPSISGEECAIVRIRRSRLYVTLGSLGSRVSITSFVRGKDGEAGEIEQSGKVLLGDTIVAINGVPVAAHTSPTDVARVVISLPRPFELYFQRASWDVLDGQE